MASKNTPTQKHSISTNSLMAIAIAVTLLVAIVCVVIGYNLAKSLVRETRAVASETKASSDIDTKLQNADTLLSAYEALGSKVDKISDALPTDANFPEIVVIM